MQPLQIKLLGGFDLSHGSKSLTSVTTERLQSLLTYLILNRHTPQLRQHLALLFWADSTDAQARTNLRRTIHDLRRILPDVEQFITIDTKTLQWRPDAPATLDVVEFEQAIAEAETAAQHSESATVRRALERATQVYQGKLLPNCYDEWIEPEQERLHATCVRIHTWLIQLLQAHQDYSAALRYAQQLLHLDPLNETAYLHLIHLHGSSGDRATALRLYHRCMTVLREELGVDPSSTTRQLYEQLLREEEAGDSGRVGVEEWTSERVDERESPHAPSPVQLIAHVDAPPPPPPPTLPPVHIDWAEAPDVSVFYGRESEQTLLQQWILKDLPEEKNVSRCCRLIAILGMGGIGKTTLVVKVARELIQNSKFNTQNFEFVIWRSLRNAPPLQTLLADLVLVLSQQQETQTNLTRFMHYLRCHRCLLIFDNLETLFQEGDRAGQYQPQ